MREAIAAPSRQERPIRCECLAKNRLVVPGKTIPCFHAACNEQPYAAPHVAHRKPAAVGAKCHDRRVDEVLHVSQASEALDIPQSDTATLP